MHLRSGKLIASGQTRPSRVSTQGSGTGTKVQLPPIVEDSYSWETESTTSTSLSMASHTNEGLEDEMQNVCFEVPLFNTLLIHVRNNLKGAQLYVDPSNQMVVKLENGL